MNNRLYYFLVPFGMVLLIADTMLFYQMIGIAAVYFSICLLLLFIIGYIFYLKEQGKFGSSSKVKFKSHKIINIKPIDNKKILFYKKVLFAEIFLIILLIARILIII